MHYQVHHLISFTFLSIFWHADFSNYFWLPAPKVLRNGTQIDCTEKDLKKIADFLGSKCSRLRKKGDAQLGHVGNKKESCLFRESEKQSILMNFFILQVVQVSLEYRKPLMYFRPNGPFPFLKVSFSLASDLQKIRIIGRASNILNVSWCTKSDVYEFSFFTKSVVFEFVGFRFSS